MVALSVNINKIALLRNARAGEHPDPLAFALSAIECGAQGITVHPRPDLRHITPDDVYKIKAKIGEVELNIEGNPKSLATEKYTGFLPLVKKVLPTQCTLVPDTSTQLTSDHGWNLEKEEDYLKKTILELKELGIRVSLFMDADCSQWNLLEKIAPDRVELFTGPYAQHFGSEKEEFYFAQLLQASKKITEMGIGLNAGHDLNLQNLVIIKKLKNLQEVSIGQAIVTESLEWGWKNTIQKYLQVLAE